MNENEIIDAVCEHLRASGCQKTNQCSTTEQGIDLVAKPPHPLAAFSIDGEGDGVRIRARTASLLPLSPCDGERGKGQCRCRNDEEAAC